LEDLWPSPIPRKSQRPFEGIVLLNWTEDN
jgi:hypothetical protein